MVLWGGSTLGNVGDTIKIGENRSVGKDVSFSFGGRPGKAAVAEWC